MCGWVAQTVVIKNFEQVGVFEVGKRLTRFVVIYEHDLKARRIENIPLATDSHVPPIIVHYPEIISFLAQDTV